MSASLKPTTNSAVGVDTAGEDHNTRRNHHSRRLDTPTSWIDSLLRVVVDAGCVEILGWGSVEVGRGLAELWE